MFKIKLAGINVLVHNKYGYTELLCRDYVTDEEHTDFEVAAIESDIVNEIKSADIPITADYAESVCLHREIAERLAEYDAFVLHSALIECDGKGIAFTARSGVGKSTHIALWKKVYGKSVRIVNGDKPIVRFSDGVAYGFGTPWCGKENAGENIYCKFEALCFLERGKENVIFPLAAELGAISLLSQIYIPKDSENAAKTLELADRFAQNVSFYKLACNTDDEAARISHNAIMKG